LKLKTAFSQHVIENDPFIDWDSAKILRSESHWHRRRVTEGFLINQKSLEINDLNQKMV